MFILEGPWVWNMLIDLLSYTQQSLIQTSYIPKIICPQCIPNHLSKSIMAPRSNNVVSCLS